MSILAAARSIVIALAAVLPTLLMGGAAQAIDIRLVEGADPAMSVVELSGKIERGDAQKVQDFLSSQRTGRQIAVHLNSPGGSLSDGLMMGRYFHANMIRTYVKDARAKCLSACSLAFLGGRDEATASVYRVKNADAALGFHSFRNNMPDREFTLADMHTAVATTQKIILMVADYMTAIGADLEFLSMMLEAPASSMNYISNEKALTLGIHVHQSSSGRLLQPVSSDGRR